MNIKDFLMSGALSILVTALAYLAFCGLGDQLTGLAEFLGLPLLTSANDPIYHIGNAIMGLCHALFILTIGSIIFIIGMFSAAVINKVRGK